MPVFKEVGVVGAGTMGHGIAQIVAMAGMSVILVDRDLQALNKAQSKINANLHKAVSLNKISVTAANDAQERIQFCQQLSFLNNADLVIEAVPENMALKKEIFRTLDGTVSKNCILASNTSSLNIAEMGKESSRPELILGLHFFNPVHIMKLLEIVHTESTAPAVLDKAKIFAANIGKTAIIVKNSPGFATSRLGICFALEAMRMLEQKVASAEDIDAAMVLGYGHPMGPLKLTDLVGLDVRLSIANYLHSELKNPAFTPPAILQQLVSEGKLGQKSGQGFYAW